MQTQLLRPWVLRSTLRRVAGAGRGSLAHSVLTCSRVNVTFFSCTLKDGNADVNEHPRRQVLVQRRAESCWFTMLLEIRIGLCACCGLVCGVAAVLPAVEVCCCSRTGMHLHELKRRGEETCKKRALLSNLSSLVYNV